MTAPSPLLGIFVGGRGRRMGGVQKALLPAPDTHEPLIGRLVRLAREAGLEVVLVGESAALGGALPAVPRLVDAPQGIGPLGGLSALLQHAGVRPVLCVACDLPFVTRALLDKLATHASCAPVLAPRDADTGKWQPLFARYLPELVLPALAEGLRRGERSFQAVLARLVTDELQLSEAEWRNLRDWDTPQDLLAER